MAFHDINWDLLNIYDISNKAVRDLKFESRVETRVFENWTHETRDETRDETRVFSIS